MADWYLAPSLAALFDELDARWPNRDHRSDGDKGDAAHAKTVSDHNPDYTAGGVVRAIDADKDGIDVQQLLDATVRDPRVAYVIWNRHIASATDDGMPWDWEPYPGTNPHTGHVHISIKHTRAAETDTSVWFKAAPPEGDNVTKEQADELLKLQRDMLAELKGMNARIGYIANDGMKDLDALRDKQAGPD